MTTQSFVQQSQSGATSFVGPDAVNMYRAALLKSSISLYIKTGLIPTRGVTISKMLALAGQYTGKTYKSSQKEQALADLQKWVDTMKAAMPYVDENGLSI